MTARAGSRREVADGLGAAYGAAMNAPADSVAALPLGAPDEPGAPTASVLSPRAFWAVFAFGWLAYGSLTAITVVMQGGGLLGALADAATVVAPLAMPAAALAAARKRLLRPRASLLRFAGHKLAVGAGYAAVVALLGVSLTAVLPDSPLREFEGDLWTACFAYGLAALFLYTVFLVFLMWLDALERVQETRTVASREAMLRAQAEAKALRAQFNPHFVFNTLHSLMLLVRKEPETAERAIEDVAALIRYASTLQRRGVDQVPLGKELAFAERYLALEKLRLADRLRVTWDVGDDLDDVLVPALSLQTLLENSIKHGLSPKPDGGSVRIRATEEGGTVRMSVVDDGLGADPEEVAGSGTGLQLLRDRLATVYGDAARLEWETKPGRGFSVTFTVPARRVVAATEPAG